MPQVLAFTPLLIFLVDCSSNAKLEDFVVPISTLIQSKVQFTVTGKLFQSPVEQYSMAWIDNKQTQRDVHQQLHPIPAFAMVVETNIFFSKDTRYR
jgi:hypothetical protein